MASKKSYSRYFIILQEDERGYGLAPGKTPTGYAKIEIKNSKCKISYYVQNLKPDSNKYCMVLICGKKGCQKLINIGNINLDEQGRADVSYEYNTENIGDTNISVDKVIGASISRIVDSNVISLMSGFTTTDIPNDWKTYGLMDINDSRSEINIFEKYEKSIEMNKEEKDAEEKIDKEHKEKSEEEKETTKDIRKEKKEVGIAEKTKEHKEEIMEAKEEDIGEGKKEIREAKEEDIGAVKKEIREAKEEEIEEDKEEIKEAKEEDVRKEIKEVKEEEIREEIKKEMREEKEQEIREEIKEELREEKKEEVKQELRKEATEDKKESMEKFFDNLGAGMEKYWDIFPKINKSVWYKVNVENLDHMCDMSNYDKYVVMYYPMISYYPYIKDYKHYLVGYKYDQNCKIKYMMYAIPGSKASKCQPFAGKTGFVTWMKSSNWDGNEGYWIMFYDFKNSNILIPVKKNK